MEIESLSDDLKRIQRPVLGSKRKPLPPKHALSEIVDIDDELKIIKQENLQGTVNTITTPVEAHLFSKSVLALVNCDRNINGSTEWSTFIIENELMPKLKSHYPLFHDSMKQFIIS